MNFTKTLGVVSLALILAACSKQAEEQPKLFFLVFFYWDFLDDTRRIPS